jgi:hypothetical protein
MFRFVVTWPSGVRTTVESEASLVAVGHSPFVDVFIDDPDVLPVHCTLALRPDGCAQLEAHAPVRFGARALDRGDVALLGPVSAVAVGQAQLTIHWAASR